MSVRLNEYTLGAVIGLAVCALAVLKVIYFPKGLPIDQKWLDLGYVTIYLGGSLAASNWRFRKKFSVLVLAWYLLRRPRAGLFYLLSSSSSLVDQGLGAPCNN